MLSHLQLKDVSTAHVTEAFAGASSPHSIQACPAVSRSAHDGFAGSMDFPAIDEVYRLKRYRVLYNREKIFLHPRMPVYSLRVEDHYDLTFEIGGAVGSRETKMQQHT
jgi:hypothetical protein